MIWKGWDVIYLFLEMLEFWRILSLKIIKILHDESLNSYHSHIYMFIKLKTIHLLFTVYEHWVWSSCVDPKELVMQLKSRFTCTFTYTCCFYSGSTHPHTSTHFHLQIHPKSFYSYPGRIAKNIILSLWNKCSRYFGYYHLLHYSRRVSALKKVNTRK